MRISRPMEITMLAEIILSMGICGMAKITLPTQLECVSRDE